MRLTNKDQKITFSIVGAGNRARCYMNALETFFSGKYSLEYIFEPLKENQEFFINNFGVKKENCFLGIDNFIKTPRLTDVVIIATLDTMHYVPTLHAIEVGYDILLEKPISYSMEETLDIYKKAKEKNVFVGICHTLRHQPFFLKLKEIIDSERLGKVVDIQHNENIGYFHFAHSYVRGNWRNKEVAAPTIVAKSCHDMDILVYLLGKPCTKLSSMGSLNYFTYKNFKNGMAHKCFECKKEIKCPYSCLKIYGRSPLIKSITFDTTSQEAFYKNLRETNYSTCVFDSDNDVVDHQVTILEFKGGVHATFNMSAFTKEISRTIKVMCELGEIRGDSHKNVIEITPFGQETETITITKGIEGGHGGGDIGIMKGFINSYVNNKNFNSTLEASIEAHVMAFCAEQSRLKKGKLMNIKKIIKENLK